MQDLTPKRIGGVEVRPLNAVEQAAVDDFVAERERERLERQARERKEREDQRTKILEATAALPIEERLARIEAWIYDYRPSYVPPPRFK